MRCHGRRTILPTLLAVYCLLGPDVLAAQDASYDEVVPESAETDEGMFDVHRVGDQLLFEIPDDLLGREMIVMSRYHRVQEGQGAAGQRMAPNIVVLCLAVFGLRFCGQGMMTHISMTAMARWFRANRAKAIAVAVLGFPISEALWPPLGVVVLDVMGWRETWLVIAGLILAVFLPALTLMTRKGRTPQGEGDNTEAPGMLGRQWTRGEVLRHWTFWTILPGLLAPPFIGTCVFFHQVHIATVRGYDLSVMALGFAMYAGISVASSLACGPIVDRIGPARVLPVLLLPLAVAIAILAIPAGVEIWFLTLAGIGISHGLVITLIGAIWPTLYGTRWIGSIKALATSGAVMSTAAGPGLTGAIIDMGVPFPEQALFLSAYCLAMTALFTAVAPKINAMLVAPRSAVPA